MIFYDAHNHLQDERLKARRAEIMAAAATLPVGRMVVNGSCESDWPEVLALAQDYPIVVPSFGYHPWYVGERTPEWQAMLVSFLDAEPSAVGEIGLDKWIEGADLARQEEAFVWQWRLAVKRGLPVSVHCLQAWGWLLDILRREPRPGPGFVLHSFGGPEEMVPELAKMGAFFSLPGHFAHERKTRQRETFLHIPLDRLLIETDAPDQSLPPERTRFPLPPADGKPVNHPANIAAVYEFAAELLKVPPQELTEQVEANFHRLFGDLVIDCAF